MANYYSYNTNQVQADINMDNAIKDIQNQLLNIPTDSQLGQKANQTDLDTTNANVSANTTALVDRVTNVKTFGVIGDGVTDDTTALQSAFNSGKPLFFPYGCHCIISSALSAPSGKLLKIIGSGKDDCSIKQTSKALRLAYINGNNTEISGISFYGNGIGFVTDPQNQNGALLDVLGNGIDITHCRFQDADYISVLVRSVGSDPNTMAFITNNEFINSWAEEITFWSSYGVIKGNLFRKSKFNAIVTRGSHEVLIEGNIFDTISVTDVAIDIRDSYDSIPLACSRVSIQNNHFIDCWLPISSTAENAWVASTAYIVGVQVAANQNVYRCTTAGTSGSTAPSGTGTSITDGTAVWNYVCAQPKHDYIHITDNKFVNPTKPSYDNFVRLQQCTNVKFNRNLLSKFSGVRGLYITDSTNCEANGNTIDTGAEGMNLNVDGLIVADSNIFTNLTGTSIVLRSPYTNFNTCSANNNKFYNVDTGINVNSAYVGRVQANNNMFRTITTMGIKITTALSILQTIGNVFADGTTKCFQTLIQPTTWIKGKNVNGDGESGTTGIRPANPTIGQGYFDTTLNKPISCKTRATLDINGNVSVAAVWVDGTGTTA